MAALVPSFALESEWMLSLLQAAVLAASVFVAQALTAATVHELEAVGANINEARQNAVRAALQQSMEQLVVVDRTTADGALVRDRVLSRSEEHTSELQSRGHLVCRLLLE